MVARTLDSTNLVWDKSQVFAPEIQSFMLDLDDADHRHGLLTESRPRHLMALQDPNEQLEQFRALLTGNAAKNAVDRSE